MSSDITATFIAAATKPLARPSGFDPLVHTRALLAANTSHDRLGFEEITRAG